jgi:hypothetical protein
MGAALATATAVMAQPAYEFRERLDAAAYAEAVADLPAEKIDPGQVRASKLPVWGVRVMSVEPGTQAESMGLEAGWVIERLNGIEYWNHKQGAAGAAPGQPLRMQAVSPEGERREWLFEPGRIGIQTENLHQTGLYLLQNVPAGEWDRDLLIADQAWKDGRHELAETALRRARDKGMPADRFSRYFGAQLAADAGAQGLSAELLDALVEELAEDGGIPRFFRPGVRAMALTHGKTSLLKDASEELAGFREELQASSVSMWEAWLEGAKWPESMLEDAREAVGNNLMSQVVRVEDGWDQVFRHSAPDSLHDGSHAAVTEAPGYERFVFRTPEPLRDGIFELRGAFGDSGESLPFSEMTLQLIDLGKRAAAANSGGWNPASWTVAGVRLRREAGHGQVVYLSGGPVPDEVATQRSFPRVSPGQAAKLKNSIEAGEPVDLPQESTFKVTLIKKGGFAEVAVNDVSYLRVPVAPDVGELGCVIHSSGLAVVWEEISLRPLPQE